VVKHPIGIEVDNKLKHKIQKLTVVLAQLKQIILLKPVVFQRDHLEPNLLIYKIVNRKAHKICY